VGEGRKVEGEAAALQHDRRAVVAEIVVAVDEDRTVRPADHLGQALVAELGQRHVDGAFYMAGGELLGGARVEDQNARLGGGGGEGLPVDQPGPPIGLNLRDQRAIAVIIDLRVKRGSRGGRGRGRIRGGDGQSGE
jgi:hypothetical protein